MHIAPYQPAAREGHDPERPRKLLMHKREIERLIGKTHEKGLTLVPTRMYFSGPAREGRAGARARQGAARQARGDPRARAAPRDGAGAEAAPVAVRAAWTDVLAAQSRGAPVPSALTISHWMRRHGRALAIAAAAALFAGIFALRLVVDDPEQTLGLTYALPVAIVAVCLGRTAGLVGRGVGVALWMTQRSIQGADIEVGRVVSRAVTYGLLGGLLGHFVERGRARAAPARGGGGRLPRSARARAGDRLHGGVRRRGPLVLREPEDRVRSLATRSRNGSRTRRSGTSACTRTTANRRWPPRSAARRLASRSTPSTG